MTHVAHQLLDYTSNALVAYGTHNASAGAMPPGWTAVKVERFNPTTTGFAGQLMTDGQGNYRIAIRGTDSWNPLNPLSDVSLNAALATGRWHPQMDDAIWFMGDAIRQIATDRGFRDIDSVRNVLDGSGHSAGGALYELGAKFYGLRGMNLDGPSVGQQVQDPRFAQLKQEQRNNGLGDLQDNYQWGAGDFQVRRYTAIGEAGQAIEGAEVFNSPLLTDRNQALKNLYELGAQTGSPVGMAGVGQVAGQMVGQHGIYTIAKHEGFGNPIQTQQQQLVQSNLAKGLSASGYAENTLHYEPLGSTGLAFQVSVYRNTAGELVEVRVPGEHINGAFVAKGPPVSSVGQADGTVRSLGPIDHLFGSQSPDEVIDNIRNRFEDAQRQVSPIILDLDGNGIQTVGLEAGVHFDHDGNGFAQRTGWLGQGDGLLVWDTNGNGHIDNGRELFGDNTLLANGLRAVNGFAALAQHDSNGDGRIDASDAIWQHLRVWVDADTNGHTGTGELRTLDQVAGCGDVFNVANDERWRVAA